MEAMPVRTRTPPRSASQDTSTSVPNPRWALKRESSRTFRKTLLTGALAFFVKNQKEPPKSTAESVSSAEDLEDDFEEDDFVEEVTEVIHEDDKEGMSL